MRTTITVALSLAAGAYLALTLRYHLPCLVYMALSRGDGR